MYAQTLVALVAAVALSGVAAAPRHHHGGGNYGFGGNYGGNYGQSSGGNYGQSSDDNSGSSSDDNSASSSGGNYGSQASSGGGSTGTLSSNVLCTGCQQDGQGANGSADGQVASLTSNENFINFCAGSDSGPSDLPITNGVQITSGSCNPVPMGVIAATTNMPSAKFLSPKNLDTVAANQNFTIQMQINNLVTGSFVNPNTNYYSAPCFVDGSGNVVGHSHVTVEQISDLQTTQLTDPTQFAFFKGLNEAADNGVLSVVVDGGLPAGTYRLSSINACANHQPVLVAVAQRGSLDDAVYFTVSDGGDNGGNNDGNNGGNNYGNNGGNNNYGQGNYGNNDNNNDQSDNNGNGGNNYGNYGNYNVASGGSSSSSSDSSSSSSGSSDSSSSSSSGSCNAKRSTRFARRLSKRRMNLERDLEKLERTLEDLEKRHGAEYFAQA